MNTFLVGGGPTAETYKDEWLTPPAFIAALGPFDLDPASPVVRPWPTAARHYSIENDGLSQPWEGRVWMNPPYSPDIEPWMARLADHGNGIAFVFARTETGWFHRTVWQRADGLLFLAGRVEFYHVTGAPSRNSAGAASVLVAYGTENADALARSAIAGRFVRVERGEAVASPRQRDLFRADPDTK